MLGHRPALLALALSSCSADKTSGYDDMGAAADGDYDGYGDGGSSGGSGDGGSGDDGYDPEDEDDYSLLRPAATNAYVFVANPDRGTVTRVSVPSLAVITTEVGNEPDAVVTTEDYETAVVFNKGDDTVSIVDAATLAVKTVDVRDDLNRMELSPDGRWAFLWHDESSEDDGASSSDGVVSFNEVSLVDVENATHHPIVVGFNPRGVSFLDDGSLGVVVSDSYLALVDLTEDEPDPVRIQLVEDLLDPPAAQEIVLAPDGSFGVVRQFGVSSLLLVDFQRGDTTDLEMGDLPTDLDLTPDGEDFVAVARVSKELWVFSVDDPLAEADVIPLPEDEVLGSITMSPDGTKGLLYSTATGISHFSAWDRRSDSVTTYGLVKPVDRVDITPDGGTALFIHSDENGEDVDPDSIFYDHFAVTMVELDDYFANPLRLAAEPTEWAFTEDGERGFFIMDGEPYLEVLDFASLLYDEISLKSEPVHVGVLPDTTWAYASQVHDLGRISFYDHADGTLQTITGFELNSGIEH